ncbi:hypothetical protein CEXT_314111 [Caerostris extrusa]|uniref:Uncharacterized protein n=1 Tax=Caerostris extrusa TaxID=172846 RepID=A0AAV4XBZ1_CAEEX|nr:hypothetical protein CEXT_314111 [Caerostris extrusa]
MDKKFFESVVPKGNQKFEDSSSKLYRFIQDQITDESVSKECDDKEQKPVFVEEARRMCVYHLMASIQYIYTRYIFHKKTFYSWFKDSFVES